MRIWVLALSSDTLEISLSVISVFRRIKFIIVLCLFLCLLLWLSGFLGGFISGSLGRLSGFLSLLELVLSNPLSSDLV